MTLSLTPRAIAQVLFKRATPLLVIFFTVVAVAGAYLLLATPKYQSTAQLVVRFGDRSIPQVDRSEKSELTPSDRREIVLANAAILGSHDLAQATIESFGVEQVYPDIVADPPTRWSVMDEAVRQFELDLAIVVGQQDNVISVSLLHADKKLAPQLVQKLIELYVQRQAQVYQEPELSFLDQESGEAKQRLAASQEALDQFKGQWHVTDYDQEVVDLLKQRGDVETALRSAEATLAAAKQRQKDLTTQLADIPRTTAATASGEKYRGLDDAQQRLSDLQGKRNQMLATYKQDGVALAQVEAGIAAARSDLGARQHDLQARNSASPNTVYQTLQIDRARATSDVASGAEPVRVLGAQLASIDARLGDLQQQRGTFTSLQRQTSIAEDTYKSLAARYEDARVKNSLNQQRISHAAVISDPSVPYRKARPRTLITLVASLVGAGILALGVVLMLEALDDRFTIPAQLAAALPVPVLASFGSNPRNRNKSARMA